MNQVDADESDPGSSSEASISLIQLIQGQVALIKFVKNKNNTTAMHGDPCKLPKLKIKYNPDPEGYQAAGHKAPDMTGTSVSASVTQGQTFA